MNFKERKEGRFIVSLAGDDKHVFLNNFPNFEIEDRESELEMIDVNIQNIPQTDDCIISINENDDKNGFSVIMKGLKVCRKDCLVVDTNNRTKLFIAKYLLNAW